MRPYALLLLAGLTGCEAIIDFDKLRRGNAMTDGGAQGDMTHAPESCIPTVGGPYFDQTHFDEITVHPPLVLVVEDLDGDGYPEIAFGSADQNIYVLTNEKDRSFTNSATLPTTCTAGSIGTLGVGDFDGDGANDMVVGCGNRIINQPQQQVFYLRGAGGGTFEPAVAFSHPPALAIAGVVGDFDGDGLADAVYADQVSSNTVVYWGSPSGFPSAFSSPVAATSHPVDVATASLGGDGILDLVVADYPTDTMPGDYQVIRRARNSGASRTFSASPADMLAIASRTPLGCALGDLDGDGHADLVGYESGASLYWSIAKPPSVPPPNASVSTFDHAQALAVGDLNCDGRADAVLTHTVGLSDAISDRFEVFVAGPSGALVQSFAHDVETDQNGKSPPEAGDVKIADLDRDGYADIIMLTYDSDATSSVRILWGMPSGS